MPSRDLKRVDRINAQLRRELGVLVHALVREYDLPSVSVNDVQTSRDLDVATVWVTTRNAEDATESVKALSKLAGELRHRLSKTVRFRRVPQLRFKYDDSVDRGETIETLLQKEKDAGRL